MTTEFRLREVMEGQPVPPNLSELSRASGVSYPTVRAIYHNLTTRVDLASLDALARALGVPPGDLIGQASAGRAKAAKRGKR